MHKNELLELHARMVTIKDALIEMDDVPEDTFAKYDEMHLSPEDSNISKAKHKQAVFVLGEALANAMNDDEFSDAGRIGMRMGELAEDVDA